MCLMCDPTDISRFVTAGNATFTLSSCKTGAHYTFKCEGNDTRPDDFFVKLLTGPDNSRDFQYIGMLKQGKFRTTSKSKLTMEATSVKAFDFFCRQVLETRKLPSAIALEFRHEGKCGRCGRKLTVPESLDTGLGEECASQIGVPYGKR